MAVDVLAQDLRFPEGPAFDPQGDLWCVELKGAVLTRWSKGEVIRYDVGGAPNGLAFDRTGRAWFCDAQRNAVMRLDPRRGSVDTIARDLDGAPLNKPNDLAFDPAGNLVFTCPGDSRTDPSGMVCGLTPDGSVTKLLDGLYFPNGLAFTHGGAELVVAETYRQRLWKGRWDAQRARWIAPQPWADVGGNVDGVALGADTLLYLAVYGTGTITTVDRDGHVAGRHPLSGANPTNCAFDPSQVLGLVVTEAEHGRLLSLSSLGPGAGVFLGDATWP